MQTPIKSESCKLISLIHRLWTTEHPFVLHRQNKSTDLSKDQADRPLHPFQNVGLLTGHQGFAKFTPC